MKYAKYLARQSIPEWQSHYFKYKRLKKELKVLVRVHESNPAKFPEAQQEYVDLLYEELENVNQFFEAKEKELEEQYGQLKNLLAESWKKTPSNKRSSILPSFTRRHKDKKKHAVSTSLVKEGMSNSLQPTLDKENEKATKHKSLPPLSINKDDKHNNNNNNGLNPISPRRTVASPLNPATIIPPSSSSSSSNHATLPSSPPPSNNQSPEISPSHSQSNSPSDSPSDSPSHSPSHTPLSFPTTTRAPMRDAEAPKPYMNDEEEEEDGKEPQKATLAKRFRFVIKRALEEVHRGLSMLKDFSSLNSVGFRKIIKKHDKVPGFPSLSYFLEHEVYKSHFHTSETPANLLKEVETVYANMFTRGNLRQATDKLRVPTTEDLHDWVSFRFGLFVGGCVILSAYLLGQPTEVTKNTSYGENIAFAFRFMGIPIFWLWTFASVMLIWNAVRINYVFIFGWDPRKHVSPRHLFEVAATMSFLWLLAFTGYNNCAAGIYPWDVVSPAAYPFALLVVTLTAVFFPINTFYRSSRVWMFQTMIRILRTPLLPVKFKDFFYTNQFTSLKYAFSDMGDTVYLYTLAVWKTENASSVASWTQSALIYRPTLQGYPSFLRFLQCIRRYRDSKDSRHLINAGKYAFSVLTVIGSGVRKAFPNNIIIFIIYAIIAAISTLYSWSWDVLMDWDLGHLNCKTWLRPNLMYKKPWVYYLAIFLDLAFRSMWGVTLGTTSNNVTLTPLNTIVCVTEIIRRFIWNIFRLENEHLKNCSHSNNIALPTLLESYRFSGSPSNLHLNHLNFKNDKSHHMKDYEDEEMEGEGEVVLEEHEMEMLDKVTGIRHRRIGITEGY